MSKGATPVDHQAVTFLLPPDPVTWGERMEAACQVLERRFGVSLQRAHSGTKFNVTQLDIPDRSKYFRQRMRTKSRWFSLVPATLSSALPAEPLAALERHAGLKHLNFGGSSYFGGEIYSAICSIDPSAAFDESLFMEMGDALHAHSAAYLPSAAEHRLRLAHRCIVFGANAVRLDLEDRMPEEEALPVICESLYAGLAPLQPHHFGWLNYWSQQVCEYVGFPQNLEGSPILQHCYRTPAGAWIVKLEAEPFAPRNVAQLHLLKDMYERFPRVAIRLGTSATE